MTDCGRGRSPWQRAPRRAPQGCAARAANGDPLVHPRVVGLGIDLRHRRRAISPRGRRPLRGDDDMANRGSPGDFAGALNIGREQGLSCGVPHGVGDPRGVAHPFPRRIKPQIIEVRDAQLGELTLPHPTGGAIHSRRAREASTTPTGRYTARSRLSRRERSSRNGWRVSKSFPPRGGEFHRERRDGKDRVSGP
jgi:hypothetical protein